MTPLRPSLSRPAIAVVLVALAGCSSPLARQAELDLQRSVYESVRRELAPAAAAARDIVTSRQEVVSQLGINPELMPELERRAGPGAYDKNALP
jgi:hypothetical protein